MPQVRIFIQYSNVDGCFIGVKGNLILSIIVAKPVKVGLICTNVVLFCFCAAMDWKLKHKLDHKEED